MKNIRIIETGIDVSGVIDDLKKHPNDWESQKNIDQADSLLNHGWDYLPIGVLQLVIGGQMFEGQFIGDSEYCFPTPAYPNHLSMIKLLMDRFTQFRRCGFLSMPVGGSVGKHIDEGTYYLTKDRYHFSILGRYRYMVGDEEAVIEPGTFFWFNNKLPHGAENVGDCTRISFVVDVPHSKDNP